MTGNLTKDDDESLHAPDAVDAVSGQAPRPQTGVARTWVSRLLTAGAAAAAVVFLVPLLVNLFGLLVVRHPFIGYSDNIVADSEAVATGHLQYGNPATQFVGFAYTPVFTWIVAGLLKVFWWVGWGPLVSMTAAIVAVVSIIRLLWTQFQGWMGRLTSAGFVIALSLGSLSAFPFLGPGPFPLNAIEEGRPDQLAWCLFVIAATRVFRDLLSPATSSRRRMIVTGLLLMLSVGTKQTTLVPCIVIAGVALVAPHLIDAPRTGRARAWLRSSTVLAVFVVSSAVLGVILQATSHSYAYDLLVSGPLALRQAGADLAPGADEPPAAHAATRRTRRPHRLHGMGLEP